APKRRTVSFPRGGYPDPDDDVGGTLVAHARAVSVSPGGNRALLLFSLTRPVQRGPDYALRFRFAGMFATRTAGPLHPLPFVLHDLPPSGIVGRVYRGECLELWNLEAGRKLLRWTKPRETVTTFQITPDGRRAVVAGASPWRGIQVRDVS